ncbi:MAG: OFA family MFS transporter [Holophaga sp.]|nr:OFA family MFS transporter [Holophaga sp.]
MKNRWLIALAAVGVHASLGSVYAWSVFKKPFIQAFGWNEVQAGLPFGLAIFLLGTSAAVMGHVVEKRGPRFSGLISTALWSLGLLGIGVVTSTLISDNTLRIWLVCAFCVVAGVGLGTGYVTPVSTLIKWFPDRRGLATGLAIMGFGFGAFFGAPIMGLLIAGGKSFTIMGMTIPVPFMVPALGVSGTFLTLGVIYLVVMALSSLYLAPPPADWKPAGMAEALASGKQKPAMDLMPMNANEAVRTWPFYGLWIMMFINITCGIAVLSVASPMAQEITGMSAVTAAGVVGMIGLFNGVGRLVWASLSDLLGRPLTYIAFFVIEVVAFYFLPSLRGVLLFQVVLFLIMTCYGGGFSTLPAYIGDLFGTKQVSAIHGYVLTAWALAGMVGSTLASALRSATGSYSTMMMVFAAVFLPALAVAIVMRVFVQRELARKQLSYRQVEAHAMDVADADAE